MLLDDFFPSPYMLMFALPDVITEKNPVEIRFQL